MDRYARQIVLPHVGAEGQARLAAARVLVVGAGGLGCPVLHYLAAAGVGHLCIVDGDVVDMTNLHRQLLYSTTDVGKGKSAAAAHRLRGSGYECAIEAVAEHLRPRNARALIARHDVVVDCTDDLFTRYLINDACVQLNKPFVHGSLHRFAGQVAVFNHAGGPTYRCAFPQEPGPGQVPDCADAGVLGVLPGVVGALQATEVLKLLLGTGGLVHDGILLVDLLAQQHRRMVLRRDAQQEAKALLRDIDAEITHAAACANDGLGMEPQEMQQRLASGERWQLLDVRQPDETPRIAALEGHRIPLDQLEHRAQELDPALPTLVTCASGVRSRMAAQWLQRQGFATVRSLIGGVRAWPLLEHEPIISTQRSDPA
ncbi:MAG: HesA/MoeB/ThiF family protein [Flavobacteriales bacterium]|nr:HesA/MoeB/ThiF family protein [Flavobacteriales bacterium]MBK7941657.1 HesA/MoeB/ThiF family protein [Flavobacteriales bacterium]